MGPVPVPAKEVRRGRRDAGEDRWVGAGGSAGRSPLSGRRLAFLHRQIRRVRDGARGQLKGVGEVAPSRRNLAALVASPSENQSGRRRSRNGETADRRVPREPIAGPSELSSWRIRVRGERFRGRDRGVRYRRRQIRRLAVHSLCLVREGLEPIAEQAAPAGDRVVHRVDREASRAHVDRRRAVRPRSVATTNGRREKRGRRLRRLSGHEPAARCQIKCPLRTRPRARRTPGFRRRGHNLRPTAERPTQIRRRGQSPLRARLGLEIAGEKRRSGGPVPHAGHRPPVEPVGGRSAFPRGRVAV